MTRYVMKTEPARYCQRCGQSRYEARGKRCPIEVGGKEIATTVHIWRRAVPS